MKQVIKYSAFLLGLLALNNSHAESPSFTYIQATKFVDGDLYYKDGSRFDVKSELDGYSLKGSFELGIFFAQVAQEKFKSDDFHGASIENTSSNVGFGLTFELPFSQLYAMLKGRKDTLEVSSSVISYTQEDDKYSLGYEMGGRVNLGRLELSANVGRPEYNKGKSYGLGAQLKITDNLGIIVEHRLLEIKDKNDRAEFESTQAGIRLSF